MRYGGPTEALAAAIVGLGAMASVDNLLGNYKALSECAGSAASR